MKKQLAVWLRRGLTVLATCIALFIVATYFLVGTEWGTRWFIGKIASLAPVDIDGERVSGTLLTEVRIPLIRYDDPKRILTIESLTLNIDWSESSLSVLSLEHVAVSRAALNSIGEPDTVPKPLEISMPALPIEIVTERASIATLIFDGNEVSYFSVTKLRAREKTIAAVEAAAKFDDISIELHSFLIEIEGEVAVKGEFGWRLSGSPWAGTGSVGGSLSKLDVQHVLTGNYPALTEGTIDLLGKIQPVVDLTTKFEEWHYQDLSADDGDVRITGTSDEYGVNFNAAVAMDATPDAMISGSATGDTRGLQSLDVTAVTELGRARATGSVSWSPDVAVDLLLLVDRIDLSTFSSLPAQDITAEARLKAADPSEFTVEVSSLTGLWNGQRSTGSGRVERQENAWICGDCRLRVGSNRVNIDGQLDGATLSGSVDIDAPSIEQLWHGLGGSLEANGKLGGSVVLPVLSGTVSASELNFAEWQLEYLSLKTNASTIDALDVDIEVRDLVRSDTRLGSARVRIIGPSTAVDVSADWHLDDYSAAVAASANIDGDKIDGQVHTARLTEPMTGDWDSSLPFSFAIESGSIRIDSIMWTNNEAFIESNFVRIEDDVLSFDGAVGGLPLSVLNNVLPDSLQIDGLADATFSIAGDNGRWSGLVDWQQRDTRLLFPSVDNDFILIVPVARATLQLNDNATALKAEINAEPELKASLEMSTEDLMIGAPINAHLQFSGEEWDWIPNLVPEIDSVEGDVSADLHATGSMESPALSGEARWQNGALDVPALNLPLSDINVSFTGTSSGDLSVDGKAAAGGGTLSIDGRIANIASSSPLFDFRLTGDKAGVLNWPGYRATTSPDLSISGDTAGAIVSGTVDIDSADIAIRELPEGAVRQSRDVTVVGREDEMREATRISGDVDVALGESFHLQAFGLDTDLEGDMRFTLREDREPQGKGEVRLVDGFFEAYGQRLEIEQGTMIFTGPLDDPLINVRATRRVEAIGGTVTAGINLSGRANELSSSIFSDPAMSEAEALSYLVLGRPLEEASAADGSNLANSAYSLGLRQAALITNQIGQTVGLDELTIGGNNQNTTELIAGKQLNSRLYARYAYGVFTRLGKLLLRYRLNDSFLVELGAGEHQSMDLLYTIEKE